MQKNEIISRIKGTLIVSCQAEEGFPLNTPDHLKAIAETAVLGGAGGIRASGPENIKHMRGVIRVPIIGIYKKKYAGSDVYITPTIEEVDEIIAAGADIIALDATNRPRPGDLSLNQIVGYIRERYDIPVMADISTHEEGLQADVLGFDLVGTTLSGYTTYSPKQKGPDIDLVRKLAREISAPVIAEGRIGTPDDVCSVIDAGAYAVVVGSMITRPHLITERFASALRKGHLAENVLAVDIGGTKISFGLVDGEGKLKFYEQIPTPKPSIGMEILEQVKLKAREMIDSSPITAIDAIGVATGGQVTPSGELIGSTDMFSDWVGAPLKKELEDDFKVPTSVINDGHAAALAEAIYGAGKGKGSVLCLVIGTGLGGGIVMDGKLLHGSWGLAGSIGQLKVKLDSGDYSPLEAIVSGPGLVDAYRRRNKKATISEGKEVAELAHRGDREAQQIIKEMGTYLGLGISHALHIIDVDCVVIGGSVAKIGEPMFNSAREGLAKFGYSTLARTPIIPAKLGEHAQLVGAALFTRNQVDSQQ